jgi:hypothetical protein
MDTENPLVIYSDSFHLTVPNGSSHFIEFIDGTLETDEKTPNDVASLDSASSVLLQLQCVDATRALHVVNALKDSGFFASTDKGSSESVLVDCLTVSDALRVMKRLDEEMILPDRNQDLAVTVAASAKKIGKLLDESNIKDLSPQMLSLGMRIATEVSLFREESPDFTPPKTNVVGQTNMATNIEHELLARVAEREKSLVISQAPQEEPLANLMQLVNSIPNTQPPAISDPFELKPTAPKGGTPHRSGKRHIN